MSIQPPFPVIRNYLPGDESALVALWNLTYASWGGYVPRSIEYWKWHILERPGVMPQDLIIFQNEREIMGYGILGPAGSVLEFAVDPRISSRNRQKVAARLIKAIEERGRSRGDAMIEFEVPLTDGSIRSALQRADFYDEEAVESLNIAIVDLAGLLTKILSHRESRILKDWSPTFLLEINPGQYRFSPYHKLFIQIGPPVAIKADPPAAVAECSVITDLSTITDLIFSRTHFDKAITSGHIVIRPVSGTRDVKALMDLIKIDSPWYTLNVDYR